MSRPTERKPLVLTVNTVGTPEHPRYTISDQNGNFWTGETWAADKDKAKLFYDANAASKKVHGLLMSEYMELPVRRFCAPVYVELFSDRPVSLAEVKAWLHKVTRLAVQATEKGNGPIEGSLGLCHIEWASLRELEPPGGSSREASP